MRKLGTVSLNGNRILLRRFLLTDAEMMYSSWASKKEVTKYLNWNPHTSIEETKMVLSKWILEYEKPSFYLWAVCLKDSSTLIGCIQAKLDENYDKASIGYCLAKPYWNQGYMTEALECVIKYLFMEVELKTIVAKHHVENTASGRVMQKCQMQYIGSSFKVDSIGNEIQYLQYQLKREYEIHTMQLSKDSFMLVASGKKTIEIRLNDEKRSKIKRFDVIRFIEPEEKKEIYVRVIERTVYSDLPSLSQAYKKEVTSLDNVSLEQVQKYGVLALKIELISEVLE